MRPLQSLLSMQACALHFSHTQFIAHTSLSISLLVRHEIDGSYGEGYFPIIKLFIRNFYGIEKNSKIQRTYKLMCMTSSAREIYSLKGLMFLERFLLLNIIYFPLLGMLEKKIILCF